MLELRFLTKNDGKFRELSELIDPKKCALVKDGTEINELQIEDMKLLVRNKALEAFKKIRRPLIVDHTGLSFELLNGFPGGLTSVFFDRLGADGIASVIGQSKNNKVKAVTYIGFCDGQQVHLFVGEITGHIADAPKGSEGFQWDTVFVPDGYSQTFAELGNVKKNEISMRRKAFDQFVKFLEAARHV